MSLIAYGAAFQEQRSSLESSAPASDDRASSSVEPMSDEPISGHPPKIIPRHGPRRGSIRPSFRYVTCGSDGNSYKNKGSGPMFQQAVLGKMSRLPASLVGDDNAAAHTLAESATSEGAKLEGGMKKGDGLVLLKLLQGFKATHLLQQILRHLSPWLLIPESHQPEMEVSPAVSENAPVPAAMEVDPMVVPIPDESDEDLLFGDDCCFFTHPAEGQVWELTLHETAVPVADLPSESEALQYILLASDEKKRRVEVYMRDLSRQERELFDTAKTKEVKAWMDHRTDPDLQTVPNDAPTLAKDARQLLLQKIVSQRWKLINFDISTAFLQGKGDGRALGIRAPPEIRAALGMRDRDQLRGIYSFGAYEEMDFVFTGIHFKQWDDGSVEMDQHKYVEQIQPIHVARLRRADPESELTGPEVKELRRINGSLQYAAVHTRPDLAAKAKSHAVSIMIVPIEESNVTFCTFSDASFATSRDQNSYQGCLVLATDWRMLANERAVVIPMAWSSKKINRVVKSTLSAEVVSLCGAIDRMSWIRLCWEWFKDPGVDITRPDEILKRAPCASLVTDCKSAYDIATKTAVPSCTELRTQLECLLLRERLQENCKMRWIHSKAMLADCLTKTMDSSLLRECIRLGGYALFDEQKVLEDRAGKRQSLKWLRDQNSAPSDKPSE
ncbi:unnamed protein product [Symbiodinium sp. CCMP2592]|nr:unnamed protein product [Symbiodinium sp. CCMP2592]